MSHLNITPIGAVVRIAYNLRCKATSPIIGLPPPKTIPSSVELSLNPLHLGYKTLINSASLDRPMISLICLCWDPTTEPVIGVFTQVNPQ